MKRGDTDPLSLSRGVSDAYAPARLEDTTCVLCNVREGQRKPMGVCKRCFRLYCNWSEKK